MTKGVCFDKLLPTQNVLPLKILRVLYQCMVWSNALVKMPNLPPVQDYGWGIVDSKVSFLWSTLPDVIKGCQDTFVKCNCRKGTCTSKCSCRKAAEVCTTLCGCNCFQSELYSLLRSILTNLKRNQFRNFRLFALISVILKPLNYWGAEDPKSVQYKDFLSFF